jgi:hypothetical protein
MQDTQKSSIFARLDTDLLRETGKTIRSISPEKKQDEAKEKNAPPKPERPNSSTLVEPNARSVERPNGPVYERTYLRRRGIKRSSYEFYLDQIEEIKRMAAEINLQGGKGNQSELVREAIDLYLEQKRKTKKLK